MLTNEIKINTSWGYIAAKTWGNENNAAVICVHGILDNAGSFDTLIPLLPKNYYYVCIDLPGHGYSSYYEKPVPITFHNLLFSIKVVCDYLSRENYIFLGHSIGARLVSVHCQLYPSISSKLILIDATYFLPTSPKLYFNTLQQSYYQVNKCLNYTSEEMPLMTYHEVVTKVRKSRMFGKLTFEAAEQITKRMIRKVGDKYRFTFDPRLKAVIEPPMGMRYVEELLKIRPHECPIIVFAMSESFAAFKRYGVTREYMDVIKNAEKHVIEGDHHIHHTKPDLIAGHISTFLLSGRQCKM